MTDYRKLLPDLDHPLTAPFWKATRAHQLVVPRCATCGYLRWPPTPLCPQCQTHGGEWTEVRPTGTLYSFATYHRALDPAFRDDVPYTVGAIELDDGPRMYGMMTGDAASFALDQAVHAVFDNVTTNVTLVRWQMTEPRSARTTECSVTVATPLGDFIQREASH